MTTPRARSEVLGHWRLGRALVLLLLLALCLIPRASSDAGGVQAASWPFSDLQAELDTTYAAVEQAIAPLPTVSLTTRYVVPLFWADGNIGTGLIGTDAQGQPDGHLVSSNVQRCTQFLEAMQRVGFNSTVITVSWPLLDPTTNYPGLQYYQAFYAQVVQQAKAMGFWVAMSSGISPTHIIDYTQYPSINTVFQGRRAQAWWMATTLQPDWEIVGAEPSTDKLLLRGIPDVNTFDATFWGKHFAALMAGKPSGTPTKYAGGASPHDPQAFWDAVLATTVDGLDGHPFPLTVAGLPPSQQFWQVMLDRFDQARAAGKPILVTQTSPYKERAAETAQQQLSADDIYLRDVWDGFQPEDQAFETMWHQISQKKDVLAVTYWWGNRTFWGGYMPYDASLSYGAATSRVDQTALVNMQDPAYVLNTEGQLWASFATGGGPPLPTPTTDPSAVPTSTPTATPEPMPCQPPEGGRRMAPTL